MTFDWCVMRVPDRQGVPKGAVYADARWSRGTSITVGFMDGDAALQDRVFDVAKEWLSASGADLFFERRNDASGANIRVSFAYAGSWSILGKYCLEEDASLPTMNFGWLTPDSQDAELRQVVLHEFGHALGFIHEHQNPSGGLTWKEDVVIAELSAPPNEWSVEEIRRNVLDTNDVEDLIATEFDPASIMLYPFPAWWNEQGIATVSNPELSEKDIHLAREIYGQD